MRGKFSKCCGLSLKNSSNSVYKNTGNYHRYHEVFKCYVKDFDDILIQLSRDIKVYYFVI